MSCNNDPIMSGFIFKRRQELSSLPILLQRQFYCLLSSVHRGTSAGTAGWLPRYLWNRKTLLLANSSSWCWPCNQQGSWEHNVFLAKNLWDRLLHFHFPTTFGPYFNFLFLSSYGDYYAVFDFLLKTHHAFMQDWSTSSHVQKLVENSVGDSSCPSAAIHVFFPLFASMRCLLNTMRREN